MWYIQFGKYLENLGYENGALAWELSHLDELTAEDHNTIISVLLKEPS